MRYLSSARQDKSILLHSSLHRMVRYFYLFICLDGVQPCGYGPNEKTKTTYKRVKKSKRELFSRRSTSLLHSLSPDPRTKPRLIHVFSLTWHPDRRKYPHVLNHITCVCAPGVSLPRKHPSPPPFPRRRLGFAWCVGRQSIVRQV
jgi:hypothetical protein